MKVPGIYKEAVTVETPKAVIRIHAPQLSPEEREKQTKNIHNATAKFIKEAYKYKQSKGVKLCV